MMVWFKTDLKWSSLSKVILSHLCTDRGHFGPKSKLNTFLGCLTLIPGGLEITENDLIYVNSSVIVSIGESKEGF